MNNILHKPSNVIQGSSFAFKINTEVPISSYTNILCKVYRQDDNTSLCKLSMNAATGYTIAITSIDSYSVKVLISHTLTAGADIGLYSTMINLVSSEPKIFEIEKFIDIKESQL